MINFRFLQREVCTWLLPPRAIQTTAFVAVLITALAFYAGGFSQISLSVRTQSQPTTELKPSALYRALLVTEIGGGFFELSDCADALRKASRIIDSASSVAAATDEALVTGTGHGGFELHVLTTQCGEEESPAQAARTRVMPPQLPRFGLGTAAGNSAGADESADFEEVLTQSAEEATSARREWTQHGWFLGLRFLSFYAHALARPEIDYFVFADAMDVTVLADPFPTLSQLAAYLDLGISSGNAGLLISQQEWRRGRHSTYMSERYEACFEQSSGAALLDKLMDSPVLNCGVFGGTRAAVLAVLGDMVRGYRRAILAASGAKRADSAMQARAERCVKLGMDMAFFNLAMRGLEAQGRISLVTNEPLCAVFRNTCGFVYHARKGDGPLAVALPSEPGGIPCEDAFPAKAAVAPNASLEEGEKWVVDFCDRAPQRDVYCRAAALPFALLHKGGFLRDLL